MPIGDDGFDERTAQAIFDTLATELTNVNADSNPRSESTYVYALLWAIASTEHSEIETTLKEVYRSAYVVDASGEELTKKAQNLGITRKDSVKATGVVTFKRDSAASTDYNIPSGTIVETLEENPVQFETTEQVTLSSGTTSVDANIQALEGGADGNVGGDAIAVMPSKPTGVDTVTNTNPTGDPTLTDTNGDPLKAGRDRENDDDLRTRVLDTDAVDEGPSANGIKLALDDVEGVISKHLNTNQESTAQNGLDPYHSEIIVYGGDTYEIAKTLTETASATNILRLQGGVNGTQNSANIYIPLLDQTVTVPITRPTKLDIDFTINVVHTDTYAGDDVVKDAVVNYIGGTRVDGASVVGIGIGENVMLNEVENRIEDVGGVDYASVTMADTDDDDTDNSTTDSDGVPVVSVSNSEVSRVDATNITLSTTSR